mmetsp:Transcript_72692/g.144095  ORF Transcript_72692/g.144095 Transcript_72692/m.144095 type:complete len:139 (+) Transcript_72692:1-417(+)
MLMPFATEVEDSGMPLASPRLAATSTSADADNEFAVGLNAATHMTLLRTGVDVVYVAAAKRLWKGFRAWTLLRDAIAADLVSDRILDLTFAFGAWCEALCSSSCGSSFDSNPPDVPAVRCHLCAGTGWKNRFTRCPHC